MSAAHAAQEDLKVLAARVKARDREAFSAVVRALQEPLRLTLDKLFPQGPYGQAGFFRGMFFTSSLQEGRSMPVALRGILGGVGQEEAASADLATVESRSTP